MAKEWCSPITKSNGRSRKGEPVAKGKRTEKWPTEQRPHSGRRRGRGAGGRDPETVAGKQTLCDTLAEAVG